MTTDTPPEPTSENQPPRKLTGQVKPTGVRDVLESVLASGISPGILRITSLEHQTGAIMIVDGVIKAAVVPAANLRRVPALQQLFSATSGTWEYSVDPNPAALAKPVDMSLAALVNWRHPKTPQRVPSLMEALDSIAAAKPTATELKPGAEEPQDQFGLQEALRAFEEKRQQELLGTAPGGIDIVPGAFLDKYHDPEIANTALNLAAIKAIPAPIVPDEQSLSGAMEAIVPAEPATPAVSVKEASKAKRRKHAAVSAGIGIALLLVAVTATHFYLQENNASNNYQRATKFLHDGYPKLAKQNFDKVVAIEPKNVKALLGRAEANKQLGELNPAIADLDAVLAIDSKNIDALRQRAVAYLKLGDHQKAVAATNDALAVQPEDADSLLTNSAAHLALSQPTEATESASKVVNGKQSEARARGLVARADALQASKKLTEARADYDEALKLSDKDRTVYGKRAATRLALKDFEGAAADATQAIFAEPNNVSWHMIRAQALEQQGKLDDALKDYDKAVGFTPNLLTYSARIHALMAAKKYNRAIADLQEVLKDPKAPPGFKAQLEDAKAKLKATPVAEIDIESIVGKTQPVRRLQYDEAVNRGIAMVDSGQGAQAVSVLAMAVRAKPSDIDVRGYLARAYSAAGIGESAISQFKIVAGVRPLTNVEKVAEAVAYTTLKQNPKAVEILSSVISEDPANHEARVLLIQALLNVNNQARALEECRLGAALAKQPADQAKFRHLYEVAKTWRPI